MRSAIASTDLCTTAICAKATPTGDKYVFEDGSRASYDFGENLSTFQWGMQAGVSVSAYKHLVVNANLVGLQRYI